MATALREQLQSSLGAHYTIERELGGGGMSRVFLATDLALGRAVVVKVLSPEHSVGISAERFRREIQLIARLQHPHIVPLLTAGSADDALFYIMPFLGGETLRDRIAREGPLSVDETLRVLRDVLDALSFAHSRGVIHRDIKPENILLEAGHAVVADFGVSKALRESGTITSAGVALGTPMYMSPEQAAGDPSADHRADLYAVGVVAFEMLSGAPPFEGSWQDVIRAHLTSEPPLLRHRRSDIPGSLGDLIARALQKDPASRPQSAAEMQAALEDVATPRSAGIAAEKQRQVRRGDAWQWAVSLGIVGLLSFIAWRSTQPKVPATAQSLAIAPFAVASGDTALVRLGQNLVTTISANLDGVGEIRVADPIAMLNHARTDGAMLSVERAAAIARKVGARSVVHGTLTSTGRTIRADAALYDAQSSATVTRFSIVGPADSLEAITDSLTWGFLRAVWSRGRPPTPNISSVTTRSPVALREFLEGERLFARGEATDAAEAYRKAVSVDTTFWFAHYRYEIARRWYALPTDTTITNRLRRHLHEIPDRDRRLLSITYNSETQSDRIRGLRELTAAFPDYAPAWLSLADYLIHHAIRSGHDAREAIGPWREVVRLMPGDVDAVGHLAFACIGTGDLECGRAAFAHLDSLVRSDSTPGRQARAMQRQLMVVLDTSPQRLLDSLARIASRDSIHPSGDPTSAILFAPALVANPRLVAMLDDYFVKNRRVLVDQFGRDVVAYGETLNRLMRGDWSGIDSAPGLFARMTGPVSQLVSRVEPMRTRVLGELQGVLSPDRRSAASALGITEPDVPIPLRVEALWIAGLNALLRRDSTVYAEHLQAIERDTSAESGIARRSLRAIAEGLAGRTAIAAESLLVLEREHGERQPKVWGAFSADRLLASQWLADDKRFAAADSLLRFTRGFLILGTAEAAIPVFALMQLQRSRIAEALDNDDEAIEFASIFLTVFDRAPPAQRGLVEEARSRIARLSPRDAPKSRL